MKIMKKMKTVLLGAVVALTASVSMAGSITVTGDANDAQWLGANSATAGISGGAANSSAYTGSGALPLLYHYVIPFQLPALPVGESITNVSLRVFLLTAYPYGAPTNIWVDVFAGRMATNSVTVAGDWDYSTKVGDNLAKISSKGGNLPFETPNTMKTNVLTAAYFQSLYDTDPDAAGKYIFLTLGADSYIAASSVQNSWATANHATAANRPTLEFTTAPAGPDVPPTAGFSASPTSGTAPLAVTFTDTSSGSISNRYWDFGDGVTSNMTVATSVAHTYAAGTYTVSLIVSGKGGAATNTQADLIAVSPSVPPTAIFSASPLSGSVPLAVTFTDTSTGTISNRFWNFGDGSTTNTLATSVVHTYMTAGTNTVSLVAVGAAGASTNTQPDLIAVTLPAAPVVGFSASPVSGYAPLTVTFTDTSTGLITNRLWNFGDGSTTNIKVTSVVHTYMTAGTYTVSLTASGYGGESTQTQINLIDAAVNVNPAILVTASANDNVFTGTNWVTVTGVTTGYAPSATFRTGTGSPYPKIDKFVIPFQLPALPVGQSITDASLSVFLIHGYIYGTNSGIYVDVFAGRIATNSMPVGGDWDYGTKVGDNLAKLYGSGGDVSAETPNRLKTVALTASYFQNIYDTDPAAAGKYIFLTLGPDALPVAASDYVEWASGDSTAQAKPTLAFTTAPVGGPVAPPPPPASVMSIGISGNQNIISWTTVQGSGYVYSVYYSTNLLNGFLPLQTGLADTVKSLTNTIVAPATFYQIKAQ